MRYPHDVAAKIPSSNRPEAVKVRTVIGWRSRGIAVVLDRLATVESAESVRQVRYKAVPRERSK